MDERFGGRQAQDMRTEANIIKDLLTIINATYIMNRTLYPHHLLKYSNYLQ